MTICVQPGARLRSVRRWTPFRTSSVRTGCRRRSRPASRVRRRFSRIRCAGQGILILAAIFAAYVLLGILYESFIHPITIISGLPSAGIGAILTLMLFRHGPRR